MNNEVVKALAGYPEAYESCYLNKDRMLRYLENIKVHLENAGEPREWMIRHFTE